MHVIIAKNTKMMVEGDHILNIEDDVLHITVSCDGKTYKFFSSVRSNIDMRLFKITGGCKNTFLTVYSHEKLTMEEYHRHNYVGNLSNIIYV